MEMLTARGAAEKSKQFRNRIAAIHTYKFTKGMDPEPFWPSMWMWDLVELPVQIDRPRRVSISRVIQVVCRRYHLTDIELLSPSRYGNDVRVRHIAFYLARKHTGHSFTNIGYKFNRDHTTVLYGYRKVLEKIAADPAFKAEIESLVRAL